VASSVKRCEICKKSFSYVCGAFTQHLRDDHQMSFKDYIVKFEYNGIAPKCACGYCDKEPPFSRGKFLKFIGEHKTYKWAHTHYIEKYGVPKCKTCKKEIGFNRLEPLQYCSPKCFPNKWNQEKCRKTLKEHYGVDNPMQLQLSKDKISIKNKNGANEALIKRRKTCIHKYGVDNIMDVQLIKDKIKETCLINHGVDHIFKTKKCKDDSSRRAKENNPAFNEKNIKTYKYKTTNLTYQSGYEYHFLELCEKLNILFKLGNGHFYKYVENLNNENNHNMLTDYSLNDYEIEIKSTWIMKKQGGPSVLFAKKSAVEAAGRKYLLILDKDYSEFLKLINIYK